MSFFTQSADRSNGGISRLSFVQRPVQPKPAATIASTAKSNELETKSAMNSIGKVTEANNNLVFTDSYSNVPADLGWQWRIWLRRKNGNNKGISTRRSMLSMQ
jgi:hypothetical protein